jgi:hypothetical protein
MSSEIFEGADELEAPSAEFIESMRDSEKEKAFVELDEIPTDEAEEISSSDVIEELSEEAEKDHIASTVCEVCLELNLLTNSIIACLRCGRAFCYHFASSIDVQYCVNCMSNISITKKVITKTYEGKNQVTGAPTFYRRRAREIKIEGLDWLFAQRRIKDLADVELDMSIEYHRNICSLMLTEAEKRRIERVHRYAGVKIVLPNDSTIITNNTTTTVKKTRTMSKNKGMEQVAAILSSMQAKGMSIEDILRTLKK